MYIHRSIEKELSEYIGKKKQVVAIKGPRQAGKTTLIKHIQKQLPKGKKHVFLTFENLSNRTLFSDNIEGFKKFYAEYDIVFIDEFQYARDGGQKLKYLYDTTDTQYVITGSSSLELTFQTSKYMVGRMMSFDLLPFSFEEFVSHKYGKMGAMLMEVKTGNSESLGAVLDEKALELLGEYIKFGGYPAVVIENTEKGKLKQLSMLYDSFMARDARTVFELVAEKETIALLKALALQTGNLVTYSELANLSGFSLGEIKKYLRVFSELYLIDLIKPYFTNKRTEIVKNPKVYFFDTGLRNFLINDFRNLEDRQDAGSLVENYVFRILRERVQLPETINFWRSKSKAEVDFVVDRGREIMPIEVKYSLGPKPGKSLYSFIEKYKPKEAYLITRNTSGDIEIGDTKLTLKPAYCF